MLKIQRNLLFEAVKKAAGALVVANDPNDAGQYIISRITENAMSLTVSSQEVVSRVVIDKAGALLSADESLTFALSGRKFSEALYVFKTPDMMSVGLKQAAAPKALEDGSTVIDLGKVEFRVKCGKKDDVFSMQAVDINVTPSIDETGKNRVVVSGNKLIQYAKAVGLAVGKATQRSEHTNVMLLAQGDKFSLVTFSDNLLAKAEFDRLDKGGPNFSTLIPYSSLTSAIKVLGDENIEIIANDGTPGTVVFQQDFVYGDTPVGTVSFRVTGAMDKFAKFEDILKKTDFNDGVSVNTQKFVEGISKVSCSFIDNVKTGIVFNAAEETMEFSKTSPTETLFTSIDVAKMPALDGLFISSRHLGLIASVCEGQETSIRFSGKTSLAQVECSPKDSLEKFYVYFMPYKG